MCGNVWRKAIGNRWRGSDRIFFMMIRNRFIRAYYWKELKDNEFKYE